MTILFTFIGLNVVSSTEFEVILYLNQMGVFNFVDDGSLPGCAVLKLSDGRKRSMSLWVEFITASGYLSARKIRSRFQTLVSSDFFHVFAGLQTFINNIDASLVSTEYSSRIFFHREPKLYISCRQLIIIREDILFI